MQLSSQSSALENIDLKDNWFTPDLEEYTSETPTYVPRVAPKNNRNTFTLLQLIQQVQESPTSEGASLSEVINSPVSEGVQNKSNLKKVWFDQQSSNIPSRNAVSRGRKRMKSPRIINIESTGPRRSTRLANKPRQKNGLFYKFS